MGQGAVRSLNSQTPPPTTTWRVESTCSCVPNSLFLPCVRQKCEDVTMATQAARDLALALNLWGVFLPSPCTKETLKLWIHLVLR